MPRALRAAHDVGALRKVGGVCLRLEAGGPVHRAVVECLLPRTPENSCSRDCLESSWKGCIGRLLLARGVEKETFTLVPQALGTTKWLLSGLSRQSL
jgi:hypothetical protein